MKSKGMYTYYLKHKEEITYLWDAIFVGTGTSNKVVLFSSVATGIEVYD